MFSLRLEKVDLGYDNHIVLSEISLEVSPGEMVGIIGANGSGKSTLIKGMSRLIPPTSGKIFIDGQNITRIRRGN